MKSLRVLMAGVAVVFMAGLALIAQQTEAPGTQMVAAAEAFLGSLKGGEKEKATFPFDSKERTNWNFVPLQDAKTKAYTRKGLPLEEMSPEQKKAALNLVKAGTSQEGNVAAVTIMSLEAILKEQETKGAMVRNPEWYFFTVFGTPSKTGKWGWRVEGHHLSLNFTMDGTQVVAATPNFFGANPAEIKSGPQKGKRILASSEDLAFQLYKALDAEQKKSADHGKPFPEPGQKETAPKVGDPVGIPAAKLTDAQKSILMKLMQSYTDRMPGDVGAAELKLAKDAGLDKVHFAFQGVPELGKGHSYRVQGPSFVIEFLNIQSDSGGNPANHIHSCWRRIKGDFGL